VLNEVHAFPQCPVRSCLSTSTSTSTSRARMHSCVWYSCILS
jgi:hypothetical protein